MTSSGVCRNKDRYTRDKDVHGAKINTSQDDVTSQHFRGLRQVNDTLKKGRVKRKGGFIIKYKSFFGDVYYSDIKFFFIVTNFQDYKN